ncbi:MAG TPA: hypothetical protein VHZ99_00875 [Steroidobacteraceae bacterium]|jgi:hypothetical protein|nr:hypothetical protein [Steroidobacteraceae bacterium]
MRCERPARHAALMAMAMAVTMGAGALSAQEQSGPCYRTEAGRIVKRRLPGAVEIPCPPPGAPTNNAPPVAQPGASATAGEQAPLSPEYTRGPPPEASPIPLPNINDFVDSVPVPDRWRIVDTLGKSVNYAEPYYNYKNNYLDPYNRNNLKADKPFAGDWFFNVSALSDTTYEWRNLEAPIDPAAELRPGSNDTFGHGGISSTIEEVIADFTLYKGDTTFRPPQWQFRLTPAFNINYTHADEVGVINVDPRKGTNRTDDFVGLQNAFVERRLNVASDRFDFDSIRVGIQPFSSDFRGFLFQDNQLGVRLFGTRANNVFQYNLAYFRRLEKDTNSELNDVTQPLRHDDIVVGNVYWQDMPVKGFTSQGIVLFNHNTETERHFDSNGVQVRPAVIGLEQPHSYEVVYLGYNGDGHFGRTNATVSVYYATGHEQPGVFSYQREDISAGFGAIEISRDFDWIRARASALYATGDSNPYDRRATGFDAPAENPQFAGGDTSYWISQALPLIGGGGVTLTSGKGVLADLRSSKGEGQSNFDNPGVFLAGIGADADLLPQLRLTVNANNIRFANTAVLAALRAQPIDGKQVGQDVSVALTYRPLMSQNIVLRTAYARLFAGNAFNSLFPHMDPNYVLFNLIVAY